MFQNPFQEVIPQILKVISWLVEVDKFVTMLSLLYVSESLPRGNPPDPEGDQLASGGG